MKGLFLLPVLFVVGLTSPSFGQDTALTYQRVLKFDSLTKTQIFDKSLIWCSKSFKDSKSAIRVKERDGGVIAGKAFLNSYYKIPGKKDSTEGLVFVDHSFDWLMEIKDGKLRFTASNIKYEYLSPTYPASYDVTSSDKPPIPILFRSKEKNELEWKLSKMYFFVNLDNLMNLLYSDIVSKKDDF
jgi:hypothetical protein